LGFTLAEVLITLVIIGVIAAITVPSLINKTNNQETVSRLKKAYSTLAQATNLIIAEEGSIPSWTTTNEKIFNLYKKHLINAKVCSQSQGCFEQGNMKWESGDVYTYNWNDSSNKLVLADGMQLLFSDASPTCHEGLTDYRMNMCGRIFVDTNGQKKPNTFGKDVFAFIIFKNGLFPEGCNTSNPTSLGRTCQILRENGVNYR